MSSNDRTAIIVEQRTDASLGIAVQCMKILMMVFNAVFLLTGICILVLGTYTKVSLYQLLELSMLYEQATPFVFITVGISMFICGGAGIFCTWKDKPTLLYMYSAVLLVTFTILLSAGIAVILYRGQLRNGFTEGLTEAVKSYGRKGETYTTSAVDYMQSKLECCGVKTYTDWYKNTEDFSDKNVPKSCCKVDRERCQTKNKDFETAKKNIHTEGCLTAVVDFVSENLGPIGGVAVGISLFQLLGSALAFCLARALGKIENKPV